MNHGSQPTVCRICERPAQLVARANNVTPIECDRCGNYLLGTETDFGLNRDEKVISRLSAMIRQDTNAGGLPTLSRSLVERARVTRLPSITERLNMLLRYLHGNSEQYLSNVDINAPRALSETWSHSAQDLQLLLHHLSQAKLVNLSIGGVARLETQGWIEAERIGQNVREGQQAFVAMWFSSEMESAYFDAIQPAIAETGHNPLRIDKKEHANKIDDEIIAEIRKSKFLVADLTGDRGGVYYEAGFAYGLGLPVIYTCRQDWFDKGIHFDLRQYNTIVWSDLVSLREQLRKRIEAVVGQGPGAPKP